MAGDRESRAKRRERKIEQGWLADPTDPSQDLAEPGTEVCDRHELPRPDA